MQLLLAPMEGLLDFALRDTLTRVGAGQGTPGLPHPSGLDRCVSEFIRITDTLLPARAFIRTMPELRNGGFTLAGVPVRGQLLGSDPTLLAENAARLAELGSHGVDLNFGCPANVVNRHGGGSALLDDPELIHRIVAAVRRAVPAHVPVSAKMRLGYHDDHRAEDNALAIEAAGASEIVVHARTKVHGYRPPAYWERIADLRREVKLPLVANGEIWTVDDALRAQAASGCTSLMLGRGIVADPGLALAIRAAVAAQAAPPAPIAETSEAQGAAPSQTASGQEIPMQKKPDALDSIAQAAINRDATGCACWHAGCRWSTPARRPPRFSHSLHCPPVGRPAAVCAVGTGAAAAAQLLAASGRPGGAPPPRRAAETVAQPAAPPLPRSPGRFRRTAHHQRCRCAECVAAA